LYLFLAVVGDSGGRSFYSPLSVGKILRMDPGELTQAREELIKERLIAYEQPYWRILTLTYPRDHGISTGMARMDSLVSGILKKSKEGAYD
jgi:hypothetical protein